MTKVSQKIVPHLWYDKEAKEAAEFYTSIFPSSRISSHTVLRDTPSGDCDVLGFELWGHNFMSISAGPLFRFNPSVSFIVNFDPSRESNARQQIDAVWEKLTEGGRVLMPIDKYPFSERYGWLEDRYGLSWQLIFTDPEGDPRPTIIPSLLFAGDNCGRAEEATKFYLSEFKNAKQGLVARYPAGMEPDREGSIMFSDFMIEGQWFAAMDSARAEPDTFNEAVSFMVSCDTQEELDAYWDKISAVPEAEQCGWCKDRFGLSWQIVPSSLDDMLSSGTPEQIDRVTQAFLPMKKFDLAKLKEAYEGV